MFEDQYHDEMAQEVLRLEGVQRATAAGHPEWRNACARCGCQLLSLEEHRCEQCPPHPI